MDVYGVEAATGPLTEWIRNVESTLVVDPPAELLGGIVEGATETQGEVDVLLSSSTADSLSDDFLLETAVAEARNRDKLDVRVASSPLDDRVLLGENDARVIVPVTGTVGIFEVEADEVVSPLREKYEEKWDEGGHVKTRAPPRSALFETADGRLSQAFSEDLQAALSAAENLDWHGTPTPIELSLVVAGRANEHLYDLSRWGEDAAFASRSSLSRAKNDLESHGILEIRSDPQDRGRPRQRLLVADDDLAEVDADDVVPTMRTVLNGHH